VATVRYLIKYSAKSVALLATMLLGLSALGDSLTMETAVQMAKDYSPDIRTLRAQFRSAEAKAALTLAPTEPTFQVAWNDMPTAFHVNNSASTTYQINQPIAFPGKAFVNHSALSEAGEAVNAQLKAMELQVASNAKAAFMALVQTRENLALNEEQRHSYERILEIAKRRYEAGAITQVDLLNAQVTLYANANDMNDLKAAERSALSQLNILVGQVGEKAWDLGRFKLKTKVIPSLATAEKNMLANRNELRSARALTSSAEFSYRLAQMSLFPDFALTAGMSHYNVDGASPWDKQDSNLRTTYMLGVQMTIPLWFVFNERETIVGAASDRAAARANLEIALNQSRITLVNTLESLKALELRMENYEHHLLPLSEQALNIALISYSAGKIDFQTLMDSATARRNNRRDYTTTIVNYVATSSSLQQLLGEEP
jgi:cobalt-zinc-cadmium efflux system outer membrane protein